MGSTRLPGKHLFDLVGEPMLYRLFERVRRANRLDLAVLATTVAPKDDCLAELAAQSKIPFYRGNEENVLERYYEAARQFNADIIVRITADCPVIDPALIDEMVSFFQAGNYDFARNSLSYPRGMDVEVFSRSSFEKVYQEGIRPYEQEHVTPYYYQHPELFKIGPYPKKDFPPYRLTVDTSADFELIRKLYEELYPNNPNFTLQDIYDTLKAHPDWVLLNAHIAQKNLEE